MSAEDLRIGDVSSSWTVHVEEMSVGVYQIRENDVYGKAGEMTDFDR